jgi:sialic acid synthase SpsE
MKPYFIAEIGSNHNQDLDRIERLINASCDAGFDAVKFQYFKADDLWSKESQDMIAAAKPGELSKDLLFDASIYAQQNGIDIGCSIFNPDDTYEISHIVDFLKVSSYECLYDKLVSACLETDKKVIISTGMCDYTEINSIYQKVIRRNNDGNKNVALMHCVSDYPASIKNIRFDILDWMLRAFGFNDFVKIGYSDHTKSSAAIVMAATLGAEIFELHVDLDDKQGIETKHGHCWDFNSAKAIIKSCHEAFNIMDWANINRFLIKSTYDTIKNERKDRVNIGFRTDNSDGKRPQIAYRR